MELQASYVVGQLVSYVQVLEVQPFCVELELSVLHFYELGLEVQLVAWVKAAQLLQC